MPVRSIIAAQQRQNRIAVVSSTGNLPCFHLGRSSDPNTGARSSYGKTIRYEPVVGIYDRDARHAEMLGETA